MRAQLTFIFLLSLNLEHLKTLEKLKKIKSYQLFDSSNIQKVFYKGLFLIKKNNYDFFST